MDSGTIEPQPTQNTSSQFVIELTGTREAGTSVWINGAEMVSAGDDDWAVQLTLESAENTFEIWLKDLAGNQGESEWVDIVLETGNVQNYVYDASGRLKRIEDD